MKKFLSILLLTISLFAKAQVAPPGMVPNNSATAFRMLSGFGIFGMPQDTFTIPADKKLFTWHADKGDTSYLWSILQQKWIILGGSSSPVSTLANFYLKDSALPSNRTVDLNGHSLTFSSGILSYALDPVASTHTFNFGSGISQLILNGADEQLHFQSNGGRFFDIGDDLGGYRLGVGNNGGAATYTADTHTFGGKTWLSEMEVPSGSETAQARWYAENGTGNGNVSAMESNADDVSANFNITGNFNDGSAVSIIGRADNSGRVITYAADTHTFNATAGVHILAIDASTSESIIELTPTTGNVRMLLQTADDNTGKGTAILADGTNSVLTYTADTHNIIGNINALNLASGSSPPTTLGIRQGVITDDDGLLSFTNKTFAALPYSATIDWNYTDGYNRTLLLAGNASLIFSNVQDGDQGTLIVIQGAGGNTLTVPDQVVTLNTGAGDTTVLGFINQNGVYYWASSVIAPTGVTSVSGTTNRITSTGGTTPVIDISASYVGQSSINTTGTITSGGMGTGAVIGGVTMTLGSDATGDIYYRNSGGVLTRLGIGTAKQTLHVVGGIPAWRDTTASASGLTIGTTTITSGTNGRVLYDNSGIVGEMTTTGSGTVLALATSPVLVTPTLGVATATTINGNTFTTGTYTLTGQAGKTLTFNGSITLTGTDAQTYTFPTTSATIARTDAAQTFTGVQTFSSAPVFSTATATANSVTANVMLKQINSVSSNTVSPVDGASVNIYEITASAGLTINAPSGTQHDGDELYLLIEGGGTARTITFGNAIYSASTDVPLPTTTVVNKLMVLKFIYTTMGSRNKYLFFGYVNNFP